MSKIIPPTSSKAASKSSSGIRYSPEFKQNAVNMVMAQGIGPAQVAKSLGVSEKSVRDWCKLMAPAASESDAVASLRAEVADLRKQLRREQQKAEILKKAAIFMAEADK